MDTFISHELRGFFQRNAQFTAEDLADLELKKDQLDPDRYDLGKKIIAEQNKKHEFKVNVKRLSEYTAHCIFTAHGSDDQGESGLAGIISRLLSNGSPVGSNVLIFFDQIYPAIPAGFPKTFFATPYDKVPSDEFLACVPYALPEGYGQFKSVSFWGTMRMNDSGVLVLSGKYQPQWMNHRFGGQWILESHTNPD